MTYAKYNNDNINDDDERVSLSQSWWFLKGDSH